jgi:hypothetical protein
MTHDPSHAESLLREAGRTAAWPVTPGLRAPVLARIIAPGATATASTRSSSPPALRVGRALAVALLALLLLAGVATALGIRLPGFEVLFVDDLPPAGTGLGLGSPVAVEEALALDAPRVLVPAGLPAPEGAFEIRDGSMRIISLAYRAEAGQPKLAGSDLALVVMAVTGDADEGLIRKLLGSGSTLDRARVNGAPGWWIAGAPHEILILRPGGSAGVLRSALAGDTLVFARDGTLYRLESALGREATIAMAESMR